MLGRYRELFVRGSAVSPDRYVELIDEVRREAALELFADRRVTVDDAAYLLGFADTRGFRRAFERWTDRTPRGHRAGLSEPR